MSLVLDSSNASLYGNSDYDLATTTLDFNQVSKSSEKALSGEFLVGANGGFDVYVIGFDYPYANISYSPDRVFVAHYKFKTGVGITSEVSKIDIGSYLGNSAIYGVAVSTYAYWSQYNDGSINPIPIDAKPFNGWDRLTKYAGTEYEGLSEMSVYPSKTLQELANNATFIEKFATNSNGGNLNLDDNYWTYFEPHAGLRNIILNSGA